MDIEKVRLIQKTISWLNDTFVSTVGMKPLEDLPYGDTGEGNTCVLANALNLNAPIIGKHWFVGHKTVELVDYNGGLEEWAIPEDVESFIQLFDGGHYPELVTSNNEG